MSKILICPTPIGNLEDITLRGLRALKEADIIACEDTRHTLKLLSHYEIKKPMISFHEHNEQERTTKLIELARQGKNIVLVSDAGMPGIQDPGATLIRRLVEENVEYSVLPGASAVITAAVGSALAPEGFVFVGFLPSKPKERKNKLDSLAKMKYPMVFYEAPHRVLKFIEEINEVFGERNLVIARELSKRYEEYIQTTTQEALMIWENKEIQGEFVFVVEGNREEHDEIGVDLISAKKQISILLDYQLSKKDAATVYHKLTGFPKNKGYQIALSTENIENNGK